LVERHARHGHDLGEHALIAVPAGELVTHGDLAPLGDVDTHQLVHARGQLIAVVPVELTHRDDGSGLTVGHLQRRVAHLTGLLTEDRTQQPLLRGQLGLTLGCDLADQHVTGPDLGADADDAALVQVGQYVLGDVRDVPGDLLGPELGVAGVHFVFLDVDRGEHVVLHQALGQDDGVLVVVPFPGHEGGQQVASDGQFALIGGGTVGQDGPDLHPRAVGPEHALVVAGALIGALELGDLIGAGGAVVVGHDDRVAGHLGDHTGLGGHDHVTGVHGCTPFHAGTHQGRLGLQQRHGLPLHVRTHQGTVGVVVLQERDHRGGHGDHLAGRDVHVVHVGGGDVVGIPLAGAHQYGLFGEVAVLGQRGVRLGDHVAVFVIGREVLDVVGDHAVGDLPVGRFDEAERVDPRVGGQRADQADVRAFRGLDRAHAAVVGGVHVAHFHP